MAPSTVKVKAAQLRHTVYRGAYSMVPPGSAKAPSFSEAQLRA